MSDGTAHATVGPFRIKVLAHPTAAGAPTISGTPAVTVAAGSNYSFTPVAGDASGNALIFGILNGPSWATFSGSTGQLSGTPQSADLGTYLDILITVSDGHVSALLPAFTIQVTPVVAVTPAQKLLNYMKGLKPGKGDSQRPVRELQCLRHDGSSAADHRRHRGRRLPSSAPFFVGETLPLTPIQSRYRTSGSRKAASCSRCCRRAIQRIVRRSLAEPRSRRNDTTAIPVNFNNLLIPSTVEYTRWQAFLALLVTEFKAINGPIIVRPFPELNSDWKWWGVQPPAQFIAVWQQMATYVRNAGVTNVLWCLNFGATALPAGYPDLGAVVRAYYPGDAYVDIVSLDSYPPSPADSAAIAV